MRRSCIEHTLIYGRSNAIAHAANDVVFIAQHKYMMGQSRLARITRNRMEQEGKQNCVRAVTITFAFGFSFLRAQRTHTHTH